MKLTNEQIKEIYYGAYSFEETSDGYLQSFQYTKEQMEYFKKAADFWYDRCMASTAKTLEFNTTATQISFDYKIIWIGSLDTIELAENGMISQIVYVKDMEREGNITFDLPAGPKNVMVYLPADATMLIKNIEINDSYTPAKKKDKVLWMGDSITQGYGPLRSAHTYVSVANRILQFDLINQGIGGYVYDKNVLMDMQYSPDKIVVSLGTNQHQSESMKDVEEYYQRLHNIYGDTPVLCITPIWRGDTQDNTKALRKFSQGIMDICRGYKNITVVDGFELVPHLSEYYLDNLHPNVIGAEIYGVKLAAAMKELHFA